MTTSWGRHNVSLVDTHIHTYVHTYAYMYYLNTYILVCTHTIPWGYHSLSAKDIHKHTFILAYTYMHSYIHTLKTIKIYNAVRPLQYVCSRLCPLRHTHSRIDIHMHYIITCRLNWLGIQHALHTQLNEINSVSSADILTYTYVTHIAHCIHTILCSHHNVSPANILVPAFILIHAFIHLCITYIQLHEASAVNLQ